MGFYGHFCAALVIAKVSQTKCYLKIAEKQLFILHIAEDLVR